MKIFGSVLVALLAFISPALAQQSTVKLCVPTSGTACPVVTATAPLPVSGTFSATLAGFTPNGNYTTLTATASSSASTALPAGVVVAFQNLSTVDVSCVLAAGAATATTNKLVVRAAATVFYTVGANDHAACINQTGSASNLVGLAGGAGLGTNFGGGGSGGGAITIASGGVASGAYASGSIASGAMVDLGAQADSAAAGDTSTASLIALIKRNNQNLTTINTSVGQAIPAGTNTIGTVGQLTYPVGATPITASATGTTAATTATLAGTGGKTTYICGYSIRANATANTNVTNTITGVITATLSSIMWVPANTAGLGVDEQIFSPCIPASGTNQAIAIVSGAPGTGGLVSAKGWGYQL